MVDFKKLLENAKEHRDELDKEAQALKEATSVPALEAKPTEGMPDWTRKIGILYGTPAKVGGGWGIEVALTVQQEKLIDHEFRKLADRGDHSTDALKGHAAMSIDKSGRARTLTITDGSRGIRYDMYDNPTIRCETRPRHPEVAEKRVERGPANEQSNPPTPPHRPTFPRPGGQTSAGLARDTSQSR